MQCVQTSGQQQHDQQQNEPASHARWARIPNGGRAAMWGPR